MRAAFVPASHSSRRSSAKGRRRETRSRWCARISGSRVGGTSTGWRRCAWFGADVAFDVLDLDEVDVEGRRAFVLAGDTAFAQSQPTVRLLPEYEVYVMGFRERDQLVPDQVRKQVASHGRGRYEGPAGVRFLVIDGVTAGLWERKRRGKVIELKVTPTRKLTRAQRAALDAEAERIGSFL